MRAGVDLNQTPHRPVLNTAVLLAEPVEKEVGERGRPAFRHSPQSATTSKQHHHEREDAPMSVNLRDWWW